MTTAHPGTIPSRRYTSGVRAGLAVYNNVLNLTTPKTSAYVGVNMATAAGLLRGARRQGLSWDELGLSPRNVGRGLRLGGVIAGIVAIGYAVALRVPLARPLLHDERAEDMTAKDLAEWTAVRIPLGTVVLEEIAFRGVLYGMERRSGRRHAAIASSVVFGLWHIVPTWKALEINEVRSPVARVAGVAGAVGVTTVAGLLLAELRERSGSLVAPAVVHVATNVGGALAAAATWHQDQRRATLAAATS